MKKLSLNEMEAVKGGTVNAPVGSGEDNKNERETTDGSIAVDYWNWPDDVNL